MAYLDELTKKITQFKRSEFRIFMNGKDLLLIEGQYGILNYDSQKISVKTKKNIVCVIGDKLRIKDLSSSEMLIQGIISRVEVDNE